MDRKSYNKEYCAKNKVKIAAVSKIYKIKNREQINEYKKKYDKAHRKEINERAKKYYQKDKDKYISKARKYYANNKELCKISRKNYYENNKESIAEQKRKYNKKNEVKIKIRQKEYRAKHKDEIKAYKQIYEKIEVNRLRQNKLRKKYSKEKPWLRRASQNRWYAKKYANDENYVKVCRLRSLFNQSFRRYSKTGKAFESKKYGVDFQAICEHLGECPGDRKYYRIHHIKELNTFNFDDPIQVKEAFAPSNHKWVTIEEHELIHDSKFV